VSINIELKRDAALPGHTHTCAVIVQRLLETIEGAGMDVNRLRVSSKDVEVRCVSCVVRCLLCVV
jgi:hypothetical protein